MATQGILFPLGRCVATPGALDALKESDQTPFHFLSRHQRGDWGTLPKEDARANDRAYKEESRIISAYETTLGTIVWVITEADRSSTCILLPSEY